MIHRKTARRGASAGRGADSVEQMRAELVESGVRFPLRKKKVALEIGVSRICCTHRLLL